MQRSPLFDKQDDRQENPAQGKEVVLKSPTVDDLDEDDDFDPSRISNVRFDDEVDDDQILLELPPMMWHERAKSKPMSPGTYVTMRSKDKEATVSSFSVTIKFWVAMAFQIKGVTKCKSRASWQQELTFERSVRHGKEIIYVAIVNSPSFEDAIDKVYYSLPRKARKLQLGCLFNEKKIRSRICTYYVRMKTGSESTSCDDDSELSSCKEDSSSNSEKGKKKKKLYTNEDLPTPKKRRMEKITLNENTLLTESSKIFEIHEKMGDYLRIIIDDQEKAIQKEKDEKVIERNEILKEREEFRKEREVWQEIKKGFELQMIQIEKQKDEMSEEIKYINEWMEKCLTEGERSSWEFFKEGKKAYFSKEEISEDDKQ